MKLVNLCPHSITFTAGVPDLPAAVRPLRLEFEERSAGSAEGIPLLQMSPRRPPELPPETPDVIYVVPTLVRLAFPRRGDLASPALLVRTDAGEVVGCRALAINDRNVECP